MKEIESYRDLLDYLMELPFEQLDQPVQIAPPHCTAEPIGLHPGLAIGSVAEFEFDSCRSIYDNKYHANDIVILTDSNIFGEDGAIGYILGPEKGFDLFDKGNPIYGKEGPTPKTDQLAPTTKKYPINEAIIVNRRLSENDKAE